MSLFSPESRISLRYIRTIFEHFIMGCNCAPRRNGQKEIRYCSICGKKVCTSCFDGYKCKKCSMDGA